jgi:hypothetical protein
VTTPGRTTVVGAVGSAAVGESEPHPPTEKAPMSNGRSAALELLI